MEDKEALESALRLAVARLRDAVWASYGCEDKQLADSLRATLEMVRAECKKRGVQCT